MAGNSNVHSSSVCVFKFVFKKNKQNTQIVIEENFRLFQVQCHERDTNTINE